MNMNHNSTGTKIALALAATAMAGILLGAIQAKSAHAVNWSSKGDQPGQPSGLLLQAFGSGRAFFHQSGVLLRDLVEMADRLADLTAQPLVQLVVFERRLLGLARG